MNMKPSQDPPPSKNQVLASDEGIDLNSPRSKAFPSIPPLPVGYEVHPIASEVPEKTLRSFWALHENIRVNQLRNDIVLFEGKILDGKNRLIICHDLGYEPRFRNFLGTEQEAAELVLGENLHERGLTISQKSMLLVIVGKVPPPKNKSGKKQGRNKMQALSKRYGISHVTLYDAARIWHHDRELGEAILSGEYTISRVKKYLAFQKINQESADDFLSGILSERELLPRRKDENSLARGLFQQIHLATRRRVPRLNLPQTTLVILF